MTLPAIKLSWNEIGLKNKIVQEGVKFMSAFLDSESIEDSGSGFIFHAISSISLKCVKNLYFGCFDEENDFSEEIDMLVKSNIIFNPPGSGGCFQTCLWKYFNENNLPVSQNILDITNPLISFHDIENMNLNFLNFGLRIFMLIRSKYRKCLIQQVFISNNFHEKKHQVSLLAFCHGNSKHAHFMLIRKLQLLFRKVVFSDIRRHTICNFCFL